jgi:hypothetical protein
MPLLPGNLPSTGVLQRRLSPSNSRTEQNFPGVPSPLPLGEIACSNSGQIVVSSVALWVFNRFLLCIAPFRPHGNRLGEVTIGCKHLSATRIK